MTKSITFVLNNICNKTLYNLLFCLYVTIYTYMNNIYVLFGHVIFIYFWYFFQFYECWGRRCGHSSYVSPVSLSLLCLYCKTLFKVAQLRCLSSSYHGPWISKSKSKNLLKFKGGNPGTLEITPVILGCWSYWWLSKWSFTVYHDTTFP